MSHVGIIGGGESDYFDLNIVGLGGSNGGNGYNLREDDNLEINNETISTIEKRGSIR